VLFVTPDLSAAMHLIWGHLENCSEKPASVTGGDLLAKLCSTCRGLLAGSGLSYSGDYQLPVSQQQQLVKDAPYSLQIWI